MLEDGAWAVPSIKDAEGIRFLAHLSAEKNRISVRDDSD